jgi:hypothetical protein
MLGSLEMYNRRVRAGQARPNPSCQSDVWHLDLVSMVDWVNSEVFTVPCIGRIELWIQSNTETVVGCCAAREVGRLEAVQPVSAQKSKSKAAGNSTYGGIPDGRVTTVLIPEASWTRGFGKAVQTWSTAIKWKGGVTLWGKSLD